MTFEKNAAAATACATSSAVEINRNDAVINDNTKPQSLKHSSDSGESCPALQIDHMTPQPQLPSLPQPAHLPAPNPDLATHPSHNVHRIPPYAIRNNSPNVMAHPQHPVPQYSPYPINPYHYPTSSVPPLYHNNGQPPAIMNPFNPILSVPEQKRSWDVSTALAISTGTMLGLSAAATVRWLNGDDWYIVAPSQQKNIKGLSSDVANDLVANESGLLLNENAGSLETVESYRLGYSHLQSNESHKDVERRELDDERNDKLDLSSQLLSIQNSLTSIQDHIENGKVHDIEDDFTNGALTKNLTSRISNVVSRLESILGIETMETTDDGVSKLVETTTQDPATETCDIVELSKDATLSSQSVNPIQENDHTLNNLVSSSKDELQQALKSLVVGKELNNANTFLAGIQLLYLFTLNLSRQPLVPRYRRVNCSNKNYMVNVEPLKGAFELLTAIGFVQNEPANQRMTKYWEWLSPTSPKFIPFASNMKDVEEIYLTRVVEAVAALEVLKVKFNDIDGKDLLHEALSAAGLNLNNSSDCNTERQQDAMT